MIGLWGRQSSKGLLARIVSPLNGRSGRTSNAPRWLSQLVLGERVRKALANGEPVVALESTVITHGLPEPLNLELALELEGLIRSPPSGNGTETSHSSSTSSTSSTGAVPATVGVIRGQLVVGLSRDELEFLAKRHLSRPMKVSSRDIGPALANRKSGGTTVAGTLAIAASVTGKGRSIELTNAGSNAKAAIRVFATGGLGGVHTGSDGWDVSADLYEMARSPMGVVSAGFKWFLDTRRSLELLESLGVTVMSLHPSFVDSLPVGWPTTSGGNQTTGSSISSKEEKYDDNLQFPGFFSRSNGQFVESPLVVGNLEEAQAILAANLDCELARPRGSLVAIPIQSQFGLRAEECRKLDELVAEIESRTDIPGNRKTPLILERLAKATKGRSLEANLALLRANATLGGSLAILDGLRRNRISSGSICRYDRLAEGRCQPLGGSTTIQSEEGLQKSDEPRRVRKGLGPVVVGCTMIDMHVSANIDQHIKANKRRSGVTYEGRPHLSVGGVGRNLAGGLQLLGHAPIFVSAIGDDQLGRMARQQLNSERLKVYLAPILVDSRLPTGSKDTTTSQEPSSCFALVLIDSQDGECECVIADLDLANRISPEVIRKHAQIITKSPLVLFDTNLRAETIVELLELCDSSRTPMFVEPTDVLALPNLIGAFDCVTNSGRGHLISSILCLTPNLLELERICSLLSESELLGTKFDPHPVDRARQLSRQLLERQLPQLRCMVVTLGENGALLALKTDVSIDVKELMEGKLANLLIANTNSSHRLHLVHLPPPPMVEKVVSVSGAGDSFAVGLVSGLLEEESLGTCFARAFRAAQVTLADRETISSGLSHIG